MTEKIPRKNAADLRHRAKLERYTEFAGAACVGFCAVGALLWTVVSLVLHFDVDSLTVAAWVQAVAAPGAIVGAFIVAQKQAQAQREQESGRLAHERAAEQERRSLESTALEEKWKREKFEEDQRALRALLTRLADYHVLLMDIVEYVCVNRERILKGAPLESLWTGLGLAESVRQEFLLSDLGGFPRRSAAAARKIRVHLDAIGREVPKLADLRPGMQSTPEIRASIVSLFDQAIYNLWIHADILERDFSELKKDLSAERQSPAIVVQPAASWKHWPEDIRMVLMQIYVSTKPR